MMTISFSYRYIRKVIILKMFLDKLPKIGGSVVEFSPATREARVRFPASAFFILHFVSTAFSLRRPEILVIFFILFSSISSVNKKSSGFILTISIAGTMPESQTRLEKQFSLFR